MRTYLTIIKKWGKEQEMKPVLNHQTSQSIMSSPSLLHTHSNMLMLTMDRRYLMAGHMWLLSHLMSRTTLVISITNTMLVMKKLIISIRSMSWTLALQQSKLLSTHPDENVAHHSEEHVTRHFEDHIAESSEAEKEDKVPQVDIDIVENGQQQEDKDVRTEEEGSNGPGVDGLLARQDSLAGVDEILQSPAIRREIDEIIGAPVEAGACC
jgi:hypothetical protein